MLCPVDTIRPLHCRSSNRPDPCTLSDFHFSACEQAHIEKNTELRKLCHRNVVSGVVRLALVVDTRRCYCNMRFHMHIICFHQLDSRMNRALSFFLVQIRSCSRWVTRISQHTISTQDTFIIQHTLMPHIYRTRSLVCFSVRVSKMWARVGGWRSCEETAHHTVAQRHSTAHNFIVLMINDLQKPSVRRAAGRCGGWCSARTVCVVNLYLWSLPSCTKYIHIA